MTFLRSALLVINATASAEEALSYWNDGPAKQAITGFVAKVTKATGPDYARSDERIAAFGNSDGDFQMLEWTSGGAGPRFGLVVHHDDAAREVAYDRKSSVGRLDRGLNEARRRGWSVVSMKNDWKSVFVGPKQ
jgi:hypothetical protein